MMMTHSNYGGDLDALARLSHRVPAAAPYDRAVPYAHTMVQDQIPERAATGNVRRRVQLACSRCRRRKIKCTGDPGDGSGCSACRSAGADRNTCAFNRIGSHLVSLHNAEVTPVNDDAGTANRSAVAHGSNTTNVFDSSVYQTHSRPFLPVLQTRSEYLQYDTYNNSPVDDYKYPSSAYPRHQSMSSNYSAENFRPFTSESISTAATPSSVYYEPGTTFSFGSLQATGPFPSTPMGRLPNVTAEAFTPLDMGSLHSSLPIQTVQERRLPVPCTQTYQPFSYMSLGIPQIRPLGSFSEPQNRSHVSVIESQSGMPWSADIGSAQTSATSRNSLRNTMAATLHHRLPVLSSRSSISSEPILGYEFSTSSASSRVSPTTETTQSGSFSSTPTSSVTSSMLPNPNIRHSTSSSHLGLTALSGNDDLPVRPSSSQEDAAGLYSFSTDVGTSDRPSSEQQHVGPSSTDDGQLQLITTPLPGLPSIGQPQHAASVDELRRRSSYEQRAATAHRMSVPNLNARY